MFKDYLDNPETYQALEEYFALTLNKCLESMKFDHTKYIAPYYNTTCVDGTRLLEANPIFSVRHATTKNILRIVIHETIKGYSKIHNKMDGAEELCLIIRLTDLSRATKDINKWVVKQETDSLG